MSLKSMIVSCWISAKTAKSPDSNVWVRQRLLCVPFAGKSRPYVKDADSYHFRVRQQASVRSSYTVYGVTFCFSDGGYQEFAGFDLDESMYYSAFLQCLTEK